MLPTPAALSRGTKLRCQHRAPQLQQLMHSFRVGMAYASLDAGQPESSNKNGNGSAPPEARRRKQLEDDQEAVRFRFEGGERSFGLKGLRRLYGSHVCVIGIGGVGSWAAEALARSGVGTITLIDLDEICVTNINRQVRHAQRALGGAPYLHMQLQF